MGISDATVATAIQGAECQANSRRLSARRGNISLDIPFYRTTYDHRSLKTQDLDAFDLDATWTLFGRFMRFGRYPDATFTFGIHIAFAHARGRYRLWKFFFSNLAQTDFGNRHIGDRAQRPPWQAAS